MQTVEKAVTVVEPAEIIYLLAKENLSWHLLGIEWHSLWYA
jgi:hypothetical protein